MAAMDDPAAAGASVTRGVVRLLPFAVLVLGLVVFLALDLQDYITFETLKEHRAWLMAQVERHKALMALAFLFGYAVVIAFSIPGGAVLTISAGFLFGTVLAASLVVVGATLGAVAVFLAARTAFGDFLRARAGTAVTRMRDGFRENALHYLLFLRLIPLFPFWLVNLVPAFLGVPLRTYVVATFFGIIPGTLIFASLGAGLGAVLDRGEEPDLSVIFEPRLLLPLIALAVFVLLPVIYKTLKARRDGARG